MRKTEDRREKNTRENPAAAAAGFPFIQGYNDVCPLVPAGTHHQRSGIMCKAHIICPTGQTSQQKGTCFCKCLFAGGGGGSRPALRGRPGRGSGVPPARHSLPIPFDSHLDPNEKPRPNGRSFPFGGGGGSRTPVRKRFRRNFSVRSWLFRLAPFPLPTGQPTRLGVG